MNKIILLAVSFMLVACSSVKGDQPRLGMKFKESYSSFVNGGFHAGLDIDVPLGTPVKSPADGEVIIAQIYNIRGIRTPIVQIQHADGIRTKYLHIDQISVKPGDKIKRNQQFAVTALTGPRGPNTTLTVGYPHLHLEVYKGGNLNDLNYLIDPMVLNMSCTGNQWVWPVGC